MPELPEVETILRFIQPAIVGQMVRDVVIRQAKLRYEVRADLPQLLQQQQVEAVFRRAKYLLLQFHFGSLVIHLGMSGTVQLMAAGIAPHKHDHVDLVFDDFVMRYNDPRRFGCILWQQKDNPLSVLNNLGVEPLSPAFDGARLYALSRNKTGIIKELIMNQRIIAGVGNIYACESLWQARISPLRPAGSCSAQQCRMLAEAIKQVLARAIRAGGSTLKDFKGADGRLGYFTRELNVYGRQNEACPACGMAIQRVVKQARACFYCANCQK